MEEYKLLNNIKNGLFLTKKFLAKFKKFINRLIVVFKVSFISELSYFK